MMNKERTKMIFLSTISALTLGGVRFATFAVFWVKKPGPFPYDFW